MKTLDFSVLLNEDIIKIMSSKYEKYYNGYYLVLSRVSKNNG